MKSVKSDADQSQRPLRRVGADDPAADLMGWLLKDVSRLLANDAALGGLRASHYRVLRAVPPDGIRVTELGARVGMTAAGSGQFVKELAASGHLAVDVDPRDRRSRLVLRTPRGDRAVAVITERLAAMERQWAERVGARRYSTFRAVLAELAR